MMSEVQSRSVQTQAQRFILLLFIASIVMFFSALTSAYIVRASDGEWLYFQMPNIFYASTVLILGSSIIAELGKQAFKKANIASAQTMFSIALVMGVGFLILQFYGWIDLVENNVFLIGNPSGSFFYILTGSHGLHIVSGLIFIVITAFIIRSQKLLYARKRSIVSNCVFYWHFLDFLWVYLFLFLLSYE